MKAPIALIQSKKNLARYRTRRATLRGSDPGWSDSDRRISVKNLSGFTTEYVGQIFVEHFTEHPVYRVQRRVWE